MKIRKIMKKFLMILCAIGISALLLITAQAQKRTKSKPRAAKPAATFGYGTVSGQVYTNKFFGLKLTVPDQWEIKKLKGKERSFPDGTKILLFAEFSGQDTKRYASFLCAARKIPASEKNFSIRKALEAMVVEPEEGMSKNVREESLGEYTLPYIEEIEEDRSKRMYAVTYNGYLIIFSFLYVEAEDLDLMKQILAAATLTGNSG